MASSPHWPPQEHPLERWLNPAWRRERSPLRSALAWSGLLGAMAVYLAACLRLGPTVGASVTALYAIPCVLAGLAFGVSGGLIVSMLTVPIQAWLFKAGLLSVQPGGIAPFLGLASAIVVGASAGFARDQHERARKRDAELVSMEVRYRLLAERTSDGVLHHEDGVVTYANPQMARIVGADEPDQLVGWPIAKLPGFVEAVHDTTLDIISAPLPAGSQTTRPTLVVVRERPARVLVSA